MVCRGLGITEQTYYRWRREYGGLKLDQAKRFKELEQENNRLKKAVSRANARQLILKEALEGKYYSPSSKRTCSSTSRGQQYLSCAMAAISVPWTVLRPIAHTCCIH